MRARSLGLLLLAVTAAGCHSVRPPMHPETPGGRWYVVGPGETLAQIAHAAGVPADDIRELNGLEPGSEVAVGALIFVLESAPVAAARTARGTGSATAAAIAGGQGSNGNGTLRWPLDDAEVNVGSPFGARAGRQHEGVDLPAPIGTPVFAAADGIVVYAGDAIRGYGNLVVLQHAGDLLTVYAHNSVLLVSQGQEVLAGERVALVGQSGRATGPHLHFEVREGQIPRDPMSYLPARSGPPQGGHP